MTKLVFVHGVATRSGPELDAAEASMRQLFAATVFPGLPFEMIAPRWGDLVPHIPPGVMATHQDGTSFAIAAGNVDDVGIGGGGTGVGGVAPQASIGAVAAAHPQLALDAVLATMVEAADAQRRPLSDTELAAFARAVDAVGDPQRAASLVAGATGDDALATALEGDVDSYGISLSSIREAVGHVTDRIRNVASTLAYDLVVGSIRPAVGFFSGDIFAYLNPGDLREKIRAVVRAGFAEALATRMADEPLIVVGHSMGGVILVDMLADLAGSQLPPDLRIDCLFTVGSQAGLFQSVGALDGGAPAIGAHIPAPPCVGHWFNVFDPIDPLAFAAEPIFAAVEDLRFDSITGVASAHTTYFKRPQFYARFRKRLGDLKLVR